MSNFPSTSTDVLIVGGGLVGLSAGPFLQHLGVRFILVERNPQPSPLPRARGIHVRTMELLRQVGLEDAVQTASASAWKQAVFGGGRRGPTMLDSEPLDHAATIEGLTRPEPSPCSFCACPQTLMEPVLRRHLEDRGGDVRFGCELVSSHETGDGLVALVRDGEGRETNVAASYLIGADGSRSFVRRHVGVGTVSTPAQQHFVNLFFRADLADRVRGRTFSQCEIANPRVRGLFLSKNNTDEWSFHMEHDPSVPALAGRPDEELADLLRDAIGASDVAVEILCKTTWSTVVRIAERYRSGRVFLAGDAAHVMPPWGGFNANTGIADVHNLAWKLAATLGGHAAPDLLDTYEEERRPIAARNGRQALLRTDFDARFGIRTEANQDAFEQLLDIGSLLMRHRYTSPQTRSNAQPGELADRLCGQIGTRFPHAWIRRKAERLSTLDLLGDAHVLIAGPRASQHRAQELECGTSQATPHLHVAGVDFQFADGSTGWEALTGLSDDGWVLVRPDGFVADRSDETLRRASRHGLS